MCVCVCVCVRACVRAPARACMWVRGHVRFDMRVRMCSCITKVPRQLRNACMLRCSCVQAASTRPRAMLSHAHVSTWHRTHAFIHGCRWPHTHAHAPPPHTHTRTQAGVKHPRQGEYPAFTPELLAVVQQRKGEIQAEVGPAAEPPAHAPGGATADADADEQAPQPCAQQQLQEQQPRHDAARSAG